MTIRGFRQACVARLLAAVTAALLTVGTPAAWAGPATSARPSTALEVRSEPAGAAVYVDGQLKGAAPIAVEGILAGDHTVRVVKDGFLENSRVVSVPASGRSLRVALTPTRTPARAMMQVEPEPPAEKGGGGGKKLLYIGAGAALLAGGTAAALLLLGGNDPPKISSVTASPAVALQSATPVSFTVSATDKDGDSLTYSWDFGDGSTGSGASAAHVYQAAGSYSVRVEVSDGKKKASGSTTAQVVSLAGVWSGPLTDCVGCIYTATFTLAQAGVVITGTFRDHFGVSSANGSGTVTGTVSAPREVVLRNSIPNVKTGVWTGTLSDDGQTISGRVDWWTRGYTFLLTRQ